MPSGPDDPSTRMEAAATAARPHSIDKRPTRVAPEEARMGKQLRHPATVIAALALFVALG